MSESKQDWRLPKNIRQIGDGSGEKKIYVEDYVITYLNRLGQGEKPGKAILFGEVRKKEQCPYIFADGALEVESFYMDDTAREELLEKMRKYFGGKRVVGWFLASEESPFVVTRDVVEIFEREFPGEDQILLVGDRQENETTVFMMEEEVLTEQPGYYIYYDKNTMMQEFMIADNKGRSVDEEGDVKDDAIKNFRRIIKSKRSRNLKTEKEAEPEHGVKQAKETKTEKEANMRKEAGGIKDTKAEEAESGKTAAERTNWRQKWKPGRIGYLAGGFMAMTVLALGVTMIYNYDRMKEVERSLARLTNNVDSQREYVTDDAGDAALVMLHIEEETTEGEADPVAAEVSMPEQTSETEQAEKSGDAAQSTAALSEEPEDALPEEGTEQSQAADQEEAAQRDGTAQETAQAASAAPRASYTVKVGDTLAAISEMYYGNLDKVTEICSLNGISDENTILPGQKILLP